MRGVSNLLAASGTTRLPRSVRSRAKRTEQAVELTSLAQDVINDSNAAVTAPDKGSESWTRWHPSKLCRKNVGNCMSSSAFATPIRDGQNLHDLSINSFTGVCQPEELAVFDRNKVELTRLKLLDLDSELQQFKMVNKMRTRPVSEQRIQFENTLQVQLAAQARTAEEKQKELRQELGARLGGYQRAGGDAALIVRRRAVGARPLLGREEASSRARSPARVRRKRKFGETKAQYDTTQKKLTDELEVTQRKLRDALRHQDQAQLVQMELLAASIDCEKQKGVTQLAEQHGKAAAFNQRVKMLLSTLNQKDEESQHMCCSKRVHEIELLRNKSADERAVTKMVMREKDETATQLTEQQRLFESLQA
ncbi:hypothetical protein PF006_g20030 [Phytophthora fragariae]|uniref:Uncharacterized protein n=1 Tax=Phytophthora fragariae TaxID=53985 RepID=A0A6A3E192_9STRA|nr:hypothetical protein PF009_g22225 [Phytophthora fragariae]KAE9112209.1 hypothetical protein PF006_g20030 [Phytophthora fragariae]